MLKQNVQFYRANFDVLGCYKVFFWLPALTSLPGAGVRDSKRFSNFGSRTSALDYSNGFSAACFRVVLEKLKEPQPEKAFSALVGPASPKDPLKRSTP